MEDKHVRFVACGADHTACTVTRAWVPDEEVKTCMTCKIKFTAVRRRVSIDTVFKKVIYSNPQNMINKSIDKVQQMAVSRSFYGLPVSFRGGIIPDEHTRYSFSP